MIATPWQRYQEANAPLPAEMLAWPFRGIGIHNVGINERPIVEPLPTCGPGELLVRVDAVGLCASDAKMIRIGNQYPLFHGRDLSRNPSRLGHEVALTVVQVGKEWQDIYHRGQRLGLQPDIFVNGQRTAFGVMIPGGLTEYITLSHSILAGDEGSYVFPVPDEVGYVDVAFLEPWACVEAAYRAKRRLEPKPGGTLWIKGNPRRARAYTMSGGLVSRQVVLTDVPDGFVAWLRSQPVEVLTYNGADAETVTREVTGGQGFDDIILLDPEYAENMAEIARSLAYQGTLTLVGIQPLDTSVMVDVGRIHYEPIAFLGCSGPDISAAYGPVVNRSELRSGGVAWMLGAGGPMGRMHIQRALEMPNGPRSVIATNRGMERLESLMRQFVPLAEAHGREFIAFSPRAEPDRLEREFTRLTAGRGFDDIVVIVPQLALMQDAVRYLAVDGMLSLFAGLPPGNAIDVPLDHVYLHGAQFIGTSGSKLKDQQFVLAKAQAGTLSPSRSLAAIGGLKAAAQGLQAVIEGTYPGKVAIFPQLPNLPLLSLTDLRIALPEVYARLGPNEVWSVQAERAPGSAEQRADEYYAATLNTIRNVVEQGRIKPADIAVIALAGQMAGAMGIDRNWNAITPWFPSTLDTRCQVYQTRMVAQEGSRLAQLTSALPITAPRMLWWKTEYPELYQRMDKILMLANYVTGRLAGLASEEAFIDPSYLTWFGLADMASRYWSHELLHAFDLALEKLPRIVPAATVIGYLTSEAASACGLISGIPLVAGVGDSVASFLGAGLVDPQQLIDIAGTFSVLALCLDSYVADTRYQMLQMLAGPLSDSHWYAMSYIGGGGLTHRWFCEQFVGKEEGHGDSVYQWLDAQAAQLPPGSEGLLFIPHLGGRACPPDPAVRGTWTGFTWKHTRGHFYRALLESVAYDYAEALAVIHEYLPAALFGDVHVIGGGAKSVLWNQIKADVLGLPYIRLGRDNTATLGSAVVGGYAVGLYPDIAATARRFAMRTNTTKDTYWPRSASQRYYQEFSMAYRQAIKDLRGTFSALSQIRPFDEQEPV